MLKEESKSELFRVNMRKGNVPMFQRYQGALDRVQFIEGINVLKLERTFPPDKDDSTISQSFDLMNVKYKVIPAKEKNQVQLVLNEGYLPRARMFYKIKVIGNEDEEKSYMKSRDFNYRETLVLEKQPENVVLPAAVDSNMYKNSKVTVEDYGLNGFKVDVETPENGFLFLSEIYYPDWKAYIDGAETEIYRTDYSLRSVYLTKGHHVVEFKFVSAEYNIFSKVSLTMLSLTLIAIVFVYAKTKKKEQ